MQIQRLLFPTDFSEPSLMCLETAASLARANDAELILLHVAEPPPAVTAGGGVAPYPMPMPALEDVQAKLNELDLGPQVHCTRHLVTGFASSVIVEFADEHRVDMIVLGTHGRTGLTRLLMGSVAEAVVRKAACPVLTLKQPATELVST